MYIGKKFKVKRVLKEGIVESGITRERVLEVIKGIMNDGHR